MCDDSICLISSSYEPKIAISRGTLQRGKRQEYFFFWISKKFKRKVSRNEFSSHSDVCSEAEGARGKKMRYMLRE
jgi:desulfoferrodoxin (superoxide reductase-like protein)